jgi:hypothetical protein
MLCDVAEQTAHARIWLGRVQPGQEGTHERFVTWLNSPEAQALIARFPLVEYRLEQQGDAVRVTMAATEPTGLVRFLRFDRLWPDFWAFVRADRPTGPNTCEPEAGWDLRARWVRAG